jgi:AraC-like DNA-binding protein
MASTALEFLSLIERNMHFERESGESTLVGFPHSTGWRNLPVLVVAQINYDATVEMGERKLLIEPGQTVALPPGVPHRFTKNSRRPAYSRWSHIQCEVFPGVSLFYLMEPPLVINGSRSRSIGQINHKLGELAVGERTLATILKQQALGWDLILLLLESVPLKEDRVDLMRNVSRLTPVLAYIGENLAKPITHDLLARTAGLSPSRFHFLFRSALGCAPYEYVQKLRLKRAQELLIRTDRSVAEIGQDVGHADPYHFSRTFRRIVGMSPVKYRKQMTVGSF